MKITLESTTQMVQVNGIPVRVWEGKTESGIPVFAMITRVGVHKDQDCSQFEQELKECKAPVMVHSWPARMILD